MNVSAPKNYGLTSSQAELDFFVDSIIAGAQPFGLDIETGYSGEETKGASLQPDHPDSFISGISFSGDPSWARYVPIAHDFSQQNLPQFEVAKSFWRLLATGKGIIHNAAFELRFMSRWFVEQLGEDSEYGEAVRETEGYFPFLADSMLESFLAAELESHGLKFITKTKYRHDQADIHSLFQNPNGKPRTAAQKKALRFNELQLTPEVISYCCEDAAWCLQIHNDYYPQVKDMFLYRVEHLIVPILCAMEDYGVQYDWPAMKAKTIEGWAFIEQLNAEIQRDLTAMTGKPQNVNIGSPQQLVQVLYNELGFKTKRKTDSGNPSTDEQALTGLAQQYPVVRKILEWKQLKKLLGTYLEKYEREYAYADDGRTHPSHMQVQVSSGRFAVASPPYQQSVCLSTSVLTLRGWVQLYDLADGEAVAQFVPGATAEGDRLEFVVPSHINRYEHDGDVVVIEPASELKGKLSGRKGEGGRWIYTPGHRIVYRTRQRQAGVAGLSDMKVTTAEQWAGRLNAQSLKSQGRRISDHRMAKAARVAGGRQLDAEERRSLRLAIAAQADGHQVSTGEYHIDVYKERKWRALEEMGLRGYVEKRKRRDASHLDVCHGYEIYPGEVKEWLDDSFEKNFIPEAILSLCADDLAWFVHEVLQWDGDSTRGETYKQVLKRRLSVEVVQAAAVLSGTPCSLYENMDQPAVTANIGTGSRYKEAGWQQARTVPVREVVPDAMMGCVTVPSGMFLVRNEEGVVQVTGNSPKKYHLELDNGTVFECDFRTFIVAPPEHYILGFDFSQVELRMLAGVAKEKALIAAFENDEDVHSATAALMLNKPIGQISKDERSKGKAQPLDAKILTPTGWRRMGDLAVGDFVIGGDGEATKITGVFPQGVKQIYRVTTSDGASTECCGEHLWTVKNKNSWNPDLLWQTRPLHELLAAGLREKNGNQQPKFSLPARPVVQYEPSADLPIDPYILGLLLGDGTFRHDWGPSFGSADPELLDAFEAETLRLGARPTERKLQGTGKPFWTMFATCTVKHRHGGNPMTEALRALGLWNKLGHEKHVPELYLRAAPADRLALLQGLLDTDGSVQYSGANFRVTSLALAEAVQELARSLGGAATLSPRSISKNSVLPQWRVQLTLPSGVAPFRLARKEANRRAVRSTKSGECLLDAVQVGEKETQCISVAATNGHYLTDSYITTHNTLNFALLYGMGIESLSERLAVSLDEAEILNTKYFSAYSNIDKWVADTQTVGRRQRFVHTWFGRKVMIWEFNSSERWIQSKGDRLCLNAPIQGAAADYMKIAMVRQHAALKAAGLLDRVHLVMNIHDALEYYVHESVDPKTVVDLLASAVTFPVAGLPKIVADWHKGKSWGTVTELKVTDGVLIETEDAPEREEYAPDNAEARATHLAAQTPSSAPAEVNPEQKMYSGQKPGVHDHKPQDPCPGDCPAYRAAQSDRHVRVTLAAAPDSAQLPRFIELLQSLPGDHIPVLVLPEGELELGAYRTALSPQQQASVSLIFGDAQVSWGLDSVDADELTAGLKF